MENLLNQIFITVDTEVIRDELMIPVQRPQDTYTFKPRKGLWATIYRGEDGNVCDWLNFLQNNEAYKKMIFKKAAIFKLKNSANICVIRTKEDVERLSIQYPSLHHKLSFYKKKLLLKCFPINYETLLDDYDGVYIDLEQLPKEMLREDREFYAFDVSSLILSNTNCIEYYQSVELGDTEDLKFTSTIIGEPKCIEPRYGQFDEILSLIRLLAIEEISNSRYLSDSPEYFEYWKRLEYIIEGSRNEIYYKNEKEFQNLNNRLMCNGFFPIQSVMSEIILSEQLREADKNVLTKFLK